MFPISRSSVVVRVGAVALVAMLAGCAHKVALQSSGRVPAAEGQIKVSKAEGDNSRLKLEVEHMAEPEKMAPGAATYVVWVQSPEGVVRNVGALKVGDDRQGKLETTTPYREFQVFVTAESSPTAASPTSERLLFANVRR